ncbi:hypothetical protein ACL7TT_15205 [Microbulbifer sp. 2304DJ12-6]|uniref:hypothetical protein n=1 Tax=Microbulbifer sp. 2304DJ12-6 TaxID=3233340 RepID=UPI0039AED1CE
MKLNLTLTLFLFASFVVADDDPLYLGTWRSNEEKTLASMDGVKGIPEKAQVFLRDELFGHLVHVIRVDSFATYFIDEKPDVLTFLPHKVDVLSGNSIRVTYYDELTDSDVTQVLKFEDNCYSLPVTKWKFREYFCRVD